MREHATLRCTIVTSETRLFLHRSKRLVFLTCGSLARKPIHSGHVSFRPLRGELRPDCASAKTHRKQEGESETDSVFRRDRLTRHRFGPGLSAAFRIRADDESSTGEFDKVAKVDLRRSPNLTCAESWRVLASRESVTRASRSFKRLCVQVSANTRDGTSRTGLTGDLGRSTSFDPLSSVADAEAAGLACSSELPGSSGESPFSGRVSQERPFVLATWGRLS